MDEKQVKTSGQQVIRNEKGQIIQGTANPNGRPKGTVSFKTIVDRAVKDIAKKNKIKESDAWDILIKRAYSEAKDGDYQFYRDLMDRYFGKPVQPIEGDFTMTQYNWSGYGDDNDLLPPKVDEDATRKQ